MSDLQLLGWGCVMLAGFAGSAVFSGMETGAYRLNRVRLYVRAQQGDRQARLLDQLIHKPAAMLGTLLIGNNLANYLGTAGLGVILGSMDMNVWQAVVINTLAVSLVLLIFGETLPKDLFAVHADRLMYPLARPLNGLRLLFTFTLVLPIIELMSRLAVRLTGGGSPELITPRLRVAEMVRHGEGYGVLSDEQAAIAQRALALFSRRAGSEATPWQRVETIRASASVAELKQQAATSRHTRFPVVNPQGKVVGTIDLIELLASDADPSQSIQSMMVPATTIPASRSVREALDRMQREHIGLLITVDAHDTPVGVVTVKDLVEPLTGEIRHW